MNKAAIHTLLLAGTCGSLNCAAHDFWVQPADFWLQPGTVTTLTLQVGHGPHRQRSPIAAARITRFDVLGPTGQRVDLRTRLHPGNGPDDGNFQLEEPGTYLLVLETDNKAQSHLPAIRFNDYLQAEGLTPALQQRIRTKRMDADGSECYSRRAKVLMQVGEPGASPGAGAGAGAGAGVGARAGASPSARPSASARRSATPGPGPTGAAQQGITQPVGLPLEIVPELNPYTEPRPASLPIRVYYEGRPLAGALVKLTQLEHDSAPLETHLTDAAGRAVFHMPGEGGWLLNVIWTKPLPRTSETDFETIFSSLSFGFPAGGTMPAPVALARPVPAEVKTGE